MEQLPHGAPIPEYTIDRESELGDGSVTTVSETYQLANCSWCLEEHPQRRVVRRRLRRSTFVCTGCLQKTTPCREFNACAGFVRCHAVWDDERCAFCTNEIQEWGAAAAAEEYWCSWCFEQQPHRLVEDNILRRSVFACNGCNRLGVRCRNWDGAEPMLGGSARWCCAMARAHPGALADGDCALCDGLVRSWGALAADPEAAAEENRQRCRRIAACSWCCQVTEHELLRRAVVGRDEFTCKGCLCRTSPCKRCDDPESECDGVPGMTRSHTVLTDSVCSACSLGKSWAELRAKIASVLAIDPTIESIRLELARPSAEREAALQAGLIRPFLMLVSMHPQARNAVASLLGWTLVEFEGFGDAHSEAWEILNANFSGFQSRANESWETMGSTRSCNWYEVVYRAGSKGFVSMASPQLSYSDSIASCTKPSGSSTKLLADLEEEFLCKMAMAQRARMTKEETKRLHEAQENEQSLRDAREQIEEVGLSGEVASYAINALTLSFLGTQTVVVGTTSMALVQTGLVLQATNSVMLQAVGAALGSAALGLTVFVFGWALLGLEMLHVGFGSSHDVLFPAVAATLHQRVMLQANGIAIEDFYEADTAEAGRQLFLREGEQAEAETAPPDVGSPRRETNPAFLLGIVPSPGIASPPQAREAGLDGTYSVRSQAD